MLLIDKHKLKQKCNNFGYLSTQFWLKGNDKNLPCRGLQCHRSISQVNRAYLCRFYFSSNLFLQLGGGTQTERGFFLGMGRSKAYFLKAGGQWERTDDKIKFDLPANSLIYAEIVTVRK